MSLGLVACPPRGMVQKHPFWGNTWDLSANPDPCRATRRVYVNLWMTSSELQFWEDRVYPKSSSQ